MPRDRLTRLQRFETNLIGAVGAPAIDALCRTLTWKVEGDHLFDDVLRSGRVPIVTVWHGRILPIIWHFRGRGVVVMASENFDGQWIARIIERLGNRTVAGSTSRGGARALIAMKREIEKGSPAAFALDGPRGPARVAQPGAVWLAAATGSPLLPVHAEASRSWTTNSWDRTMVPKPFSTVALVVGEPLEINDKSEKSASLEEALKKSEMRARQMLMLT
jgi:lysophospholipid acyltransferase (LPLAT)-like uncharacterized protein